MTVSGIFFSLLLRALAKYPLRSRIIFSGNGNTDTLRPNKSCTALLYCSRFIRRIGISAKPCPSETAECSNSRSSFTAALRTSFFSSGSFSGGISRASSTSIMVWSRSRSEVKSCALRIFNKSTLPLTFPSLPWHLMQLC